MNKFLPRTKINTKGFTLIELLTVVAIIAILSVIAATIFTGTQRNARDGRRRADVDAISKALEVGKTQYYVALTTGSFAGGVMPGGYTNASVDPQLYSYCIATGTDSTSVPGDPTTPPGFAGWVPGVVTGAVLATIGNCSTTPAAAGTNTAYSPVVPASLAPNTKVWKVCARLENDGSAFTAYCKSSAQ